MSPLKIQGLTKSFGGVIAVNDFSLVVEKGEIMGLIGPNGAGKTTLMNLISGFYKPDKGEIYLKNKRITGLKPYKIAQEGIGRTFQITRVFRELTTIENMLVPTIWQHGKSSDLKEKAINFLDFFGLAHLKYELGKNLSGGQQKLLEVARVAMVEPELFLLDEPFHGVHPSFIKIIMNYIKTIKERSGKTFLIISHDISSVMGTCERVAVMNVGGLIAQGTPEIIRNDKRVIETYLGV